MLFLQLLNLMIGLNGYTLCSGIICEELNGSDYIAVPFKDEDEHINRVMEIGYITKKNFNHRKSIIIPLFTYTLIIKK